MDWNKTYGCWYTDHAYFPVLMHFVSSSFSAILKTKLIFITLKIPKTYFPFVSYFLVFFSYQPHQPQFVHLLSLSDVISANEMENQKVSTFLMQEATSQFCFLQFLLSRKSVHQWLKIWNHGDFKSINVSFLMFSNMKVS